MESLTGLTGFYWLLFGCYALALVLGVESGRGEPDGGRVGRLLVVPLVAAATLVAVLVLRYRDETRHLVAHITDRAASLAVAVLTLIAAVAVVDLFFARFTVLASRALSRLGLSPRNRADLALVLGVGVPAAIILALFSQSNEHFRKEGQRTAAPAREGAAALETTYRIPGQPLDLLLRTPTRGYVTFAQGTIARVDLPADAAGGPRVSPVATGLRWPRGLAVVGRTLLVAELGPLPCRPAVPRCKGGDLHLRSVSEGEREIIRMSRGRVLAFDIEDDGSLANRRVILSGLPVVNTDHGLNDLVRGPEGRVYLAIGNLDTTYGSRKVTRDLLIRPHASLLGTVVSFEPSGKGLRVYARGLRNVYGLAFDSRGRLYGADNSGPTRTAYRREELLRIERGADYGYPYGPRRPSTPPALRYLRTAGSAGIAWLPGSGAGRLVLGSCGALDAVSLTLGMNHEVYASRVTRLRELPGCVTAIAVRPDGFVVTLFTAGPRGRLYVIPSRLVDGSP